MRASIFFFKWKFYLVLSSTKRRINKKENHSCLKKNFIFFLINSLNFLRIGICLFIHHLISFRTTFWNHFICFLFCLMTISIKSFIFFLFSHVQWKSESMLCNIKTSIIVSIWLFKQTKIIFFSKKKGIKTILINDKSHFHFDRVSNVFEPWNLWLIIFFF